jgi:hypothetical protein
MTESNNKSVDPKNLDQSNHDNDNDSDSQLQKTDKLDAPTNEVWHSLQILNNQIRSSKAKLSKESSFIEGAEQLFRILDNSFSARKTWNNIYHALLAAGSMNLSLHTFVFDFEIVELFSNFVV